MSEDPRNHLKWGVYADGKLIVACVLKGRAEQIAALGRRDTRREMSIEVREIDS